MRRVIAVIEVIGGLLGAVACAVSGKDTLEAGQGAVLAWVALVSLGSLVAGRMLWARKGAGVWLSCAVQAVQLPALDFPPFAYYLGLGLSLALGIQHMRPNPDGLTWGMIGRVRYGVDSWIGLGTTPNSLEDLYVGVNLVALVLLVGLAARGAPIRAD